MAFPPCPKCISMNVEPREVDEKNLVTWDCQNCGNTFKTRKP